MLFYFYLLSIAFSIIVTRLTINLFFERKKENHIHLYKASILEEVYVLFFTFLKIILPVYNLVYDIYLICFHRKIHEKIITRLFMRGRADFNHTF